jgi:anion-transporting  ArsA/GET3 family ATPase
MTFDPSRRLRQAVGLDRDGAGETEMEVSASEPGRGRLVASVLDAGETFDRLIARYAPDEPTRRRILENRFYRHLAGSLAGVLEYMAVERLYEVARDSRFEQIVLDTPPTQQALDFLEAPDRIVSFLDSGAIRLGARAWFDDGGRFRPARALGRVGERLEAYLDAVVGLDLLREAVEFFRVFTPLYEGFRRRAGEVKRLLESEDTGFLLVTSAEPDRVADTLFFARRLIERGYHLDAVIANRLHSPPTSTLRRRLRPSTSRQLLVWLSEQDRRGTDSLATLLGGTAPLVAVAMQSDPAGNLGRLTALGEEMRASLGR